MRNRRANKRIEQRNERRAEWARAVSDTDDMPANAERRGFRESLRRKLRAARSLAGGVRRLRRGDATSFSTAKAIDEQPAGGSMAGDGFDDFDRRLGLSAQDSPPPPPTSPRAPPSRPQE